MSEKSAKSENNNPEVRKGLYGVIADYTAVSKVMPETNSLTYRGYAVQDLVAECSFEEVFYLLWNGELPTEEQLAAYFAGALRAFYARTGATLVGGDTIGSGWHAFADVGVRSEEAEVLLDVLFPSRPSAVIGLG